MIVDVYPLFTTKLTFSHFYVNQFDPLKIFCFQSWQFPHIYVNYLFTETLILYVSFSSQRYKETPNKSLGYFRKIAENFTQKTKMTNASSFYVIKTVLVGSKWFWSNQIDLDLTIMIWSRPNWNGHDQNEGPNVFHFGRKSQFGPDQFILVATISFWSRPNHYGQVQGEE